MGKLAAGLCGIADYEPSQPFINVMKASRAWEARSATSWNYMSNARLKQEGHLNADGYPVRIPPGANRVGTVLLVEMPKEDKSLNGRYKLTYNGTGRIQVNGGSDVVYGANQVLFTFTANDTNMISVEFTEITSPISNMICVLDRHEADFGAGEIFRKEYLEVIKDLNQYRFMDWQQTNHSKLSRWADRPTPTSATWAPGVPVEVMVALCNKMKVNPWFNFPHLANDDYMRRFSTYVKDNLDPTLVATYEYSNEVWNFIFDQAHWAAAEAQRLWKIEGDGWMQFYGGRCAEMAIILNSVYTGTTGRFRKTMGAHTSWIDLSHYALDAPKWVAMVPGRKAPKTYFDDWAVTGYFGHSLSASQVQTWRTTLSETQAFDRMAEVLNREISGLVTTWGQQKQVADRAGLRLVMYEGGSHVTPDHATLDRNPGLLDFIEKFHYSPQMATLYTRAMTEFAKVGKEFNVFVEVSRPGKWGLWGAQRYVGDLNPRWNAIATYNRTATQPPIVVPTPTPQPENNMPEVNKVVTFTHQNSLFDHQYNGQADDDTRVPNWTWRMAQAAGKTYEATGYFGFANQWTIPPNAAVVYQDAPNPSVIPNWSENWTGKSVINALTFVPDNFDSFDRAPNVNSNNPSSPVGRGQNYRDTILRHIDAWEANAPMSGGQKRRYCIYAGWADFNSRSNGAQWNNYSAAQLKAYLDWSYGGYHKWYVDLVAMLKAARPNLNIELLDVQRVMMKTWQNTPLKTLTGSRLWEDNSPHGKETWYLLAAIVYYMEMFGAKPPANYNPLSGKGQGSGVDPVMINNWSTIVDYAWNELGNTATTPVEPPVVVEPPVTPPVTPTPTVAKPALRPESPEHWEIENVGDGVKLRIKINKLQTANPPVTSIRVRQAAEGLGAFNLPATIGSYEFTPRSDLPMDFQIAHTNTVGNSFFSTRIPIEPTNTTPPVDPTPTNPALDKIVADLEAVTKELQRISAEVDKLKA